MPNLKQAIARLIKRLAIDDIERLLGNGEFFVRGDNPHVDFRCVGRNFAFFAVAIVSFIVDFDTQKPQSFANRGRMANSHQFPP